MDENDLEIIEKRARRAHAGPWVATVKDDNAVLVNACSEDSRVRLKGWKGMILCCANEDDESWDDIAYANANFIAYARNDVPALIEEVRRLRRLLGETT